MTYKPDWQYELEDYYKASPEIVEFVRKTIEQKVKEERDRHSAPSELVAGKENKTP